MPSSASQASSHVECCRGRPKHQSFADKGMRKPGLARRRTRQLGRPLSRRMQRTSSPPQVGKARLDASRQRCSCHFSERKKFFHHTFHGSSTSTGSYTRLELQRGLGCRSTRRRLRPHCNQDLQRGGKEASRTSRRRARTSTGHSGGTSLKEAWRLTERKR